MTMRYTEDEFLDMQEIEQFGSYMEKERAERSELIADEPLTDSATELLNLLLEIGEFYMSHEVWIYEKFEADDFGADRIEMQLAEIIECADFPQDWILEHETAIREMMLMEAFQNYGICNFSYLNPALNSKTLSEEEFIDAIQKQIKLTSREEIKGELIVKLIKYLRTHGRESEAATMLEK
jgi:hypothetical protein